MTLTRSGADIRVESALLGARTGDRDDNFYLWGAMGGAALVGLGLAQAQPAKPVVAVTGDGEQLMVFGSLAAIAAAKPGNLTVVVIDNQHFGETGMQAGQAVRFEALDPFAYRARANAYGFTDGLRRLPPRTMLTMRSRPSGVRRAFSWMSIRPPKDS